MTARQQAWETLETAEAFWRLTECPVLDAIMGNYPAPAYDPEHVKALLRLLSLIAGIDSEGVRWDQLTSAVLAWSTERGLDVVRERVKAP
ncbi:MAG: hypothetical protein PVI86_19880 [Phycisphaerae bacterium]|jgi:hypothetical protein